MSSAFLTHGIMSIGNMLTASIYHYLWMKDNDYPTTTTYLPSPPPITHPPLRTTAAQHDFITDLPSLGVLRLVVLPSQFAGYLPVSPTRRIFYWYVESTNDPTTDPLVLWTK